MTETRQCGDFQALKPDLAQCDGGEHRGHSDQGKNDGDPEDAAHAVCGGWEHEQGYQRLTGPEHKHHENGPGRERTTWRCLGGLTVAVTRVQMFMVVAAAAMAVPTCGRLRPLSE